MKTKQPKNAKPVAYDAEEAAYLRRVSYYYANINEPRLASVYSIDADKEDAKEPESWRYAGASKLGVEGI